MSMKNSNETIGNRTRDLPACSAVPQPTAPPHAPGRKRTYSKEKLETLVATNNETGLEVNANKTKFMVMYRDENVGRSHNTKLIIFPLKEWNNSNTLEQSSRIKTLFRKKLRAD